MLDSTFLETGVHRIEAEAYHQDPCPQPSLASSLAKALLAQSPLHAWTQSPRLNPDWEPTESETFDIGRAAHSAILGVGAEYVAIPQSLLASNGAASTSGAKVFIEEARKQGLVALKADKVELVEAMRAAAQTKLAANGITFDPALSEQVAIAKIDGVWCRAMLDNVPLDPRAPIYDFKTCENASPRACERAIVAYGYDVQAAHYRDVWKAATGEDRPFRFVFQEKAAPWEVCVVELGPDSLMMAHRKAARAREIWNLCLSNNQWPGYPPGVHRVELPGWVHEQWLERESHEQEHKARTGADLLLTVMKLQGPAGPEGQIGTADWLA